MFFWSLERRGGATRARVLVLGLVNVVQVTSFVIYFSKIPLILNYIWHRLTF